MQRALDLASLGLGRVSPNPMVGAVIVYNDVIIGEGWHQQFGFAHAEVNAVNSVQNKDFLAESTIYVTLEPCSHFGKTPPCADLIIRSKFKKVVVAMLDPNPLVAGNGIQRIREAGIEVEMGVLESEAKMLNKRFLTFHQKKRPYVILKWAETADGFIAPTLDAAKEAKQISNKLSQLLVHKWRREEDAIMVGMNTLLHDNPNLDARLADGFKQPIRITIDERGTISGDYHFFNGKLSSIVFNYQKEEEDGAIKYLKLDPKQEPLAQLLTRLYANGIGSILVEGGSKLITRFLEANIWDEARVCVSDKTFGTGIVAPILRKPIQEKFELETDAWKVMLNLSYPK